MFAAAQTRCDDIVKALVVRMLLCMLQHMLNRAKAEPTTDISAIFSSGALDRLAAVLQLQVVLSSQTCCSVAIIDQACISAMCHLSVHVVGLTAEICKEAFREVALHR